MSRWILSIDFGTTFTAASTRERGRDPELIEMDGPFGPQVRMPSLVLAHEDGELLVGWAAETQAQVTPERVERTPKRRLGEAEPLLLGDRAVRVEDAVAAVLRAVLEEATRLRGRTEPAEVRLTHPARWARRRLDALREAARLAGIRQPLLLSEPAAAAVHFSERLAPGDLVAVYDLGGGTFDTAVLRRTDVGEFEQVGPPGGKDGLGGEAFDERLASFVMNDLREQSSADAERLQQDRRLRAHFRQSVRSSKEALSQASAVDVPLPAGLERASIRVTRDDFERLIRLDVEESVEILARTLADVGIPSETLSGIFLAGGSTRIPLVPRLVERRLGRYDTYDEPKAVVALGASRYETAPVSRPAGERETGRRPSLVPAEPPPEKTDRLKLLLEKWRPRKRRRPAALAGSVLGALVLALVAFAVVRNGSGDGTGTPTESKGAFPSTAREQELDTAIPDGVLSCVRESTPRAVAAASCEIENGLRGLFSLFPDTSPMDTRFNAVVGRGRRGSSEGCPNDEWSTWSLSGEEQGRWACYLDGGGAHIAWTNKTFSVLSIVSHARGDRDFEFLIEYFDSEVVFH